MEKLADGLQKLGEEDLLQVVQMVYDNKTQDTYTKNDVESKPSPYLHLSISLLDVLDSFCDERALLALPHVTIL